MKQNLTARGFISLLWHGSKAIDVLQTSLEIGLLDLLDCGPVTLGDLSQQLNCIPPRLYKLLDCLESLGLVERIQDVDDINEARYCSTEPLKPAVTAVLGVNSIERDRDKYQWREIYGRLPEVLRGEHSVSSEAFDWPPRTPEKIASFEESMAAGCKPIIESFLTVGNQLWTSSKNQPIRVLDVGGGDGTLACALVSNFPQLYVDVYNLPEVSPLVAEKIERCNGGDRLNFVGGDFLQETLPTGYDVILFVRVLHDWPAHITRELLTKAYNALAPNGKIVICEEFRTSERLAIQFFWNYFLIGVDSCVSRLREIEFYHRCLSEIGFENAQIFNNSFDLISAEHP
jgi:ubiquinone/menaquinone biosynthesis C-methylase UbiE